jgi:hypothetical protein
MVSKASDPIYGERLLASLELKEYEDPMSLEIQPLFLMDQMRATLETSPHQSYLMKCTNEPRVALLFP